jgi:sterol 24-C-methyltransferase
MSAIETDWQTRIIKYYRNSPNYLNGPLEGTCHFGYTEEGHPFELQTALRSMEKLLGEKLSLSPGSTVLDAGCGFGRVAGTLSSGPFHLNVVGIDLIHERLQEAKRYTESQGVSEKVGLVDGNYCSLPIADETLAGVYTIETLVHANSLEAALSEFWRVLQPGGRLVLFEYSVPPRSSLDPARKWITDNMIRRTGMASIEYFTHGAFPSLLQKANFENIEVEDISHKVWPTWRWLFRRAIRESWQSILRGEFMSDTNLAGSLLIWPYKNFLGYNVVTANKPVS